MLRTLPNGLKSVQGHQSALFLYPVRASGLLANRIGVRPAKTVALAVLKTRIVAKNSCILCIELQGVRHNTYGALGNIYGALGNIYGALGNALYGKP